MYSSEFIGGEILGKSTDVINHAKLHLTVCKPKSYVYTESHPRFNTTLDVIADSSETLYHLHREDGTCLSTALCNSDGSVRQLYPESELITNKKIWITQTLLHYNNKSAFVIQTDQQLKDGYTKAVQRMRCTQIIETTFKAKEMLDEGFTQEKVKEMINTNINPSDLELSTILEFTKLSDKEFYGNDDDDDLTPLEWMDNAKNLTKTFKTDYPGCVTQTIVKNLLYDEKDLKIAESAAELAIIACDNVVHKL